THNSPNLIEIGCGFEVEFGCALPHVGVNHEALANCWLLSEQLRGQFQCSKNVSVSITKSQLCAAGRPDPREFASCAGQSLTKIAWVAWKRCRQENFRLTETLVR